MKLASFHARRAERSYSSRSIDEARIHVAGGQFIGTNKQGIVILVGAELGSHERTGLGAVSGHAVRDQAGHKLGQPEREQSLSAKNLRLGSVM